MNTTSPATTLTCFRAELYQTGFRLRRDALCEVGDAVLTSDAIPSAVTLSLAPGFRRHWSSVHDALSDGRLDVPAIQRLLVPLLANAVRLGGRWLVAIDGTAWPRPDARTSPERTACRVLAPGSARHSIVDGWEYQWVVAIPDATGSWMLPLAVDRRSLAAGTPTQLAITQLRAIQAARAATDTLQDRPVVLLDSSYDVVRLVEAELGMDYLARQASNRVFRRAPVWSGRGRHPLHGPRFKLSDPTTHGEPDHTTVLPDPQYGTVQIDRWDGLHREERADIPLSLLRIQLGHYAPRAHRPGAPQPQWLVWTGTEPPEEAVLFRVWYSRRFAIEHGFRFLKQDLGWTRYRPRQPTSADTWSWLLALGWWLLWLARQIVVTQPRPWDPAHLPGQRPTPGQVRRGMAGLLATLGAPARPPKVRGMASGPSPGQRTGRRQRFPARKRAPAPRERRRTPRR